MKHATDNRDQQVCAIEPQQFLRATKAQRSIVRAMRDLIRSSARRTSFLVFLLVATLEISMTQVAPIA